MAVKFTLHSDQQGQAVTEYILLLSLVLMVYFGVSQGLTRIGLAQKIAAPITGPFAAAYQFGKVDAKGFTDGGPSNHPRVIGGDNNFRLFINPNMGSGGGDGW